MWNQISIGFDGEETANFGPRQEYEGEKAVYEVQTLATITPSDLQNVESGPKILCCTSSKYLTVAVNECLSLFAEECQEVLCTLNFESHITCLSWDEQSLILVIGEQNGQIHIFHAPLMQVILSLPIIEEGNAAGRSLVSATFLKDKSSDSSQIIILDSFNYLHIYSNLNIIQLDNAIHSQDFQAVAQMKASLTSKSLNMTDFDEHHQLDYIDAKCNCPHQLISAGKGDHVICLWSCHQSAVDQLHAVSLPSKSSHMRKVAVSCNGKYLFTLDNDGQMALVCARLFIVLKVCSDMIVKDFVLLETFADNRLTSCRIAVITQDDQATYFKLLSFPDFDLLYSLVVSPFSLLVSTCRDNDQAYLVEGVANEDDQSQIDTLRIRAVSEALPECRLMQLLHRRKFEQAESFAKTFGLDRQVIYKSRVSCLLESLSPWKIASLDDAFAQQLHQQFITTLQNIQDVEFVADCCMRVCLKSLHSTKTVVTYAQKALQVETDKLIENDAHAKRLMKYTAQVNATLQRLETFDHAFNQSLFSERWSSFLSCCLETEMIKYLHSDNIHVAFSIWERHKAEFIAKDVGIVCEILSSLPESFNDDQLLLWLHNSLLPTIIQLCPEMLDTVADWMMKKAKNMELSDKLGWPGNALAFLQVFPKACEQITSKDMAIVSFASQLAVLDIQKTAMDTQSAIFDLLKSIGDLQQLVQLKETYNCKLPLAEFSQTDKTLVLFSIFDVLPSVDHISKLISDFVKPFCLKYALVVDVILQKYIQNVLSLSTYNWWHWEEAPWQDQLLAIISCVKHIHIKMQCILDVSKQASVPWSAAISQLVKTASNTDHPCASYLKEQQRLVGLKSVLIKYSLHQYPIKDKSNAKKLMQYIIRQDEKSAIADATEVVHSFDNLDMRQLYLFRMRQLAQNAQVAQFLSLFDQMEPDVCADCCVRFYNLTVQMLDEQSFFNNKMIRNEAMMFTYGAILCLNRLLKQADMQQYQNNLDDLNVLYSLQKQFDVFISLDQLANEDNRIDVVSQIAAKFVQAKVSATNTSLTYAKLFALGNLLKLPRPIVCEVLVQQFASNDCFDSVHDICKLLCRTNGRSEESAVIILKMVDKLCTEHADKLACHSKLVKVLCDLMSVAQLHCNGQLLLKCLEMSRWLAIGALLHERSDKWQAPVHKHNLSKDPYSDWMFSTLYEDVALRVKSSDILPLIFKLMAFCNWQVQDQLTDVSKLVELCNSSLTYLVQKNQDSPAYIILIAIVCYLNNLIADTSGECVQKLSSIFNVLLDKQTQLITSVAKKVLMASNVDSCLVIGLLLSITRRNALAAIKVTSGQVGPDYPKQISLAATGQQLSEILQLPSDITDQFISMKKRAKWGHILSSYHISFKEAFTGNMSTHVSKLLESIACHPKMESSIVNRYCKEFELDANVALLMYLQSTLLSVNADSPPAVIERCVQNAALVSIDGSYSQKLLEMYETIFNKLDSYSYEVLQFVLEQMVRLTSADKDHDLLKSSQRGLKILEALMLYQRDSKASDDEIDHWSKHQPTAGDLPAISAKRLPFHPINSCDPWKVISGELNLKTLEIWLAMASIVKISSNQVRVMTVTNVWQECKKNDANDQGHMDEHCMQSLYDIITQISNCEMATACASWLMQRLPKGSQKVEVARFAVTCAEQWAKESNDQKSKSALKKICASYQRLATTEVLNKYALATEENLSLACKPVKLIFDILEKNDVAQLICNSQPNALEACRQIADINDCNFDKICINLIEKWLPLPAATSDNLHDQTIDFNLHMTMVKESPVHDGVEQEQNIARLIYLLQNQTDNLFRNGYLIQIASSDDTSSSQKYQALRCLLSIVNEQAILSLTNKTADELRHYMEDLLCVSQLEALNLPYSVDTFKQISKVELVESILHTHANQPAALQVVCWLCIDYKLYLPSIWQVILKQMSTMSQCTEQLYHILYTVMNIPQLCHNQAFVQLLNTLLIGQLSQASNLNMTSEHVRLCYSSLLMLLRCPVLNGLDIEQMAELYVKNKMHCLAAACILRLQTDEDIRIERIQEYLQKISAKEMLQELVELRSKHRCDTTALLPVRNMLLDYMDHKSSVQG